MSFETRFKDILSDKNLSSDEQFEKLIDENLIRVPGSSVNIRGIVIKDAIEDYFSKFSCKKPYKYDVLSSDIVTFINKAIEFENALGKHEKYKTISALSYNELALVINHLYVFKNVRRDKHASDDMTELMYYSDDGWYKSASDFVERLCRSLNSSVLKKDIQEVEAALCYYAGKPVDEERNPDWVFLNNGIYDKGYYAQNKELIPYSKDIIVVNPLPINFNPNALNSKFKFKNEEFDVEDFLLEIGNGDDSIKQLLWDVLSALVYHNRNYRKAVFLYSSIGNNGKGTFLTLCRNLVGSSLCVDIPIESFADKNLVVNLAKSRLVTGDENMVDSYIDNSTNFKNAVTGDPITVDRKYRNSLTFSFSGLILQCMNGLPMTKDKTNSFYRRILLVPFNNCFTGKENPKIKSIYLADKDVLEYVVYKALMLDVKELKDVEATSNLLEEYKEENDTLLQWWEDEGSQVDYVWDRVPWILFYGSFKWWCRLNTVRGDATIGLKKFCKEFRVRILPRVSDVWCEPSNSKFAVYSSWDIPEPLIGKYNIDELKNPNYTGKDWIKIGSNAGQYKAQYRGLCKVAKED